MLTIVFALLTAVCLDGSDRRLTPREEKFISGIGCTQATSRKNCLSVLEADGNHRCLWKNAHCSALSPSNPNVHALDTLAIGCCRGFNFETQMECQSYTDEQSCKDDHCDWIETDDPSLCLMIATTDSPLTTTFNTFMASTDSETPDNENTATTSPETSWPSVTQATDEDAGCCRGNTWQQDDACNEHLDAVLCIKHDLCQWLVGSQPDLCPPLSTTTRVFKHGRRGGSVLYDQVQGSVVHQSQDYAISLTSMLLLALAAFIAYGVYQLVLALNSRREYTKLSDDDLVQILYESA